MHEAIFVACSVLDALDWKGSEIINGGVDHDNNCDFLELSLRLVTACVYIMSNRKHTVFLVVLVVDSFKLCSLGLIKNLSEPSALSSASAGSRDSRMIPSYLCVFSDKLYGRGHSVTPLRQFLRYIEVWVRAIRIS